MRSACKPLFLFFVFLGAAGCGYSSEEAATKCDIERSAKATCFNDDTYAGCISCFETCGDECAVGESCPVQYFCSD